MPPSTALLAGGRPTTMLVAATPLQWTTALSPGGADDDDEVAGPGPNASTATSAMVAARLIRTFMSAPHLLDPELVTCRERLVAGGPRRKLETSAL